MPIPVPVDRWLDEPLSLEAGKIVLEEKFANCGRALSDFDRSFRTAFEFLQNPHKPWASGQFEQKKNDP